MASFGLLREKQERAAPVVAIVGGGFSGAMVAWHLRRLSPHASILVFEPRATLGAGLAYDTADPAHRINVPASRMSLFPEDDQHLVRWLGAHTREADDPEAAIEGGHLFPRRQVFGRYVASVLAPLVETGSIVHRRLRVADARRTADGRWRLTLSDGSTETADRLVLATSHPAPRAPRAIDAALAGHPAYVADATVAGALAAIRPDDRVLVVGSGLTAADVIATLTQAGHSGPILAVSRRGLRSRGHHLAETPDTGIDLSITPQPTALALLRAVRRALARAREAGLTWHPVFDRLRGDGGAIWRALSPVERKRLVRHLRPFWDVHRFRIAPQVERVLDGRVAGGSLVFRAAAITAVERNGDGTIRVDLRLRRGGGRLREEVDAVVVTTGPGHGAILESQPLLAGLAAAGDVCADTAGLGLAVTEESRAIGAQGRVAADLFVAGPLARGTFGELMGLPQVAEHARLVAGEVAESLAGAPGVSGAPAA
ncbi:FAD/NAD(P)-binding protein [Ensifer soli]|uniref:FAD/NAD(P)-binding protein n=1 Tax=Ciceribacter sp. sgz301302 TaxID=3342379 RepID=UPI0035BBE8DC